jgi:hypothetical protein
MTPLAENRCKLLDEPRRKAVCMTGPDASWSATSSKSILGIGQTIGPRCFDSKATGLPTLVSRKRDG